MSVITIMILAFGPKQKDCSATTASVDQVPANYVFTDPNVAARRAEQRALTERMCAKGYPGPGGKADCAVAKKLRATMLKTNAEWGISPGGQVISG
jgi:hypothetical protein